MNDDERAGSTRDETSGGQSPASPEDDRELRERCETERENMTPRETADCAGSDLSGLYDNEEDGGS